MSLFRGRLFAGALFAGAIFGAAQVAPPSSSSGWAAWRKVEIEQKRQTEERMQLLKKQNEALILTITAFVIKEQNRG